MCGFRIMHIHSAMLGCDFARLYKCCTMITHRLDDNDLCQSWASMCGFDSNTFIGTSFWNACYLCKAAGDYEDIEPFENQNNTHDHEP